MVRAVVRKQLNESPDFSDVVDEILEALIEVMLWSSNDESDESGGVPLDENYTAADIHPKTRSYLKSVVIDFVASVDNKIGKTIEDIADEERHGLDQVGHDFWLSAAGHGAGFWDGDWKKYGDALDKIARDVAPEIEWGGPYVGDDGYIHIDVN